MSTENEDTLLRIQIGEFFDYYSGGGEEIIEKLAKDTGVTVEAYRYNMFMDHIHGGLVETSRNLYEEMMIDLENDFDDLCDDDMDLVFTSDEDEDEYVPWYKKFLGLK